MDREVRIYPSPLEIPPGPSSAFPVDIPIGSSIEFSGCVRPTENGQSIEGIEYECFTPMALHQFGLILDEIENRWNDQVQRVWIHHASGFVSASHPSVWARVDSAHRAAGFQAIQFLLTAMKAKVPIWKKVHFSP